MAQENIHYGTFQFSDSSDMDTDVELEAGPAAKARSGAGHGAKREKRHTMSAYQDDDEYSTSGSSRESAQAGVKRLEAIASTWSTTGLYVAYLGYVIEHAGRASPPRT